MSGHILSNSIDFNNNFNNREYGLTFGAGFEIMKMVQVGIYFQKGLSDLNQLPDNRITHENIYFQLGYLFKPTLFKSRINNKKMSFK